MELKLSTQYGEVADCRHTWGKAVTERPPAQIPRMLLKVSPVVPFAVVRSIPFLEFISAYVFRPESCLGTCPPLYILVRAVRSGLTIGSACSCSNVLLGLAVISIVAAKVPYLCFGSRYTRQYSDKSRDLRNLYISIL